VVAWCFGPCADLACWPAARAGRLRKLEQRACLAPPPNTAAGATACRFLLRVAESPPALLLATPPQSRPSAPCACQACCRSPPSISAKTQSRPCTATQHKGTKIQQRNKIESKSNARRARGGWGLHSRRIPVQKLNPPWEIPNPRQVEKRGEGERTTQERRGPLVLFQRPEKS